MNPIKSQHSAINDKQSLQFCFLSQQQEGRVVFATLDMMTDAEINQTLVVTVNCAAKTW